MQQQNSQLTIETTSNLNGGLLSLKKMESREAISEGL